MQYLTGICKNIRKQYTYLGYVQWVFLNKAHSFVLGQWLNFKCLWLHKKQWQIQLYKNTEIQNGRQNYLCIIAQYRLPISLNTSRLFKTWALSLHLKTAVLFCNENNRIWIFNKSLLLTRKYFLAVTQSSSLEVSITPLIPLLNKNHYLVC